MTIVKGTPTITWPAPGGIVYGTPLGAAQFDAQSTVAGTFRYNLAAGSILNAGRGQALVVTFTPDDMSHYEATTAAVLIDVAPAPLIIRADDASKTAGEPNPTSRPSTAVSSSARGRKP